MALFYLNAFDLKKKTWQLESQQSSMYSVQSLRPLWKSGNQKLGINSLKVLGLCKKFNKGKLSI